MTGIIGADVMYEAIHGHIERMGDTVEHITAALIDLDASPDEVGSALVVLGDARDDGSVDLDKVLYQAALLEGFVIGCRAARIADVADTRDLVERIALWLRHVERLDEFPAAARGLPDRNVLWDVSLEVERLFKPEPGASA